MSAEESVGWGQNRVKDIRVVFSGNAAKEQLNVLAAELLERREAILDSWRADGDATPGRNVGSSLSRAQFNDHIPAVLDCLADTLEAWPDKPTPHAEKNEAEKVLEHGLQRWQQGYQLSELIREWGYLQMCVAAELERYAARIIPLSIRASCQPRVWHGQACAPRESPAARHSRATSAD